MNPAAVALERVEPSACLPLSCPEPGPGDLALLQKSSRRLPAADFSDVVQNAQARLAAGAARDAVHLLLRAVGDAESLDAPIAVSDAALLLTLGHALLGHDEDAQEWLARVQRHCTTRQGAAFQARVAVLQAAVAHLAGDDVLAVRLGNQFLVQRFARDDRHLRGVLLAVMGAAYLRVAQVAKAQQCACAIVADECGPGLAGALGALLMGEVELTRVLRQNPRFRSQLLFVDDLSGVAPDRTELAASAERWFARAALSARQLPVVQGMARSGLARAGLIRGTGRGHWDELDQQVRQHGELGCVYGRDRASVHLGIWRLLHDDASGARFVLQAPAKAALCDARGGFAYDALFYGALACAASGDSSAAVAYLAEFMARVRARHLSRVVLPPPNLEGQSCELTLVAARPKSAEIDDLIVARVTALVRDEPNQMLSSDELAILFGVSRRTLQYRFRRATGKTPKEFVTALRVEQARDLLAAGATRQRADLEKVASTTGFPNYRTFVRAFRSHYGHSPSEAAGEAAGRHGGRRACPGENQNPR